MSIPWLFFNAQVLGDMYIAKPFQVGNDDREITEEDWLAFTETLPLLINGDCKICGVRKTEACNEHIAVHPGLMLQVWADPNQGCWIIFGGKSEEVAPT